MTLSNATAALSGILPIDKPSGMTSHDVVDAVRDIYGVRRVGHSGTLDPFATGLLLVMIGDATKIAWVLSGQDKTYEAVIRFGASSDTGDPDGEITASGAPIPENRVIIESMLPTYRGSIEQAVPEYAATRVAGRRRYELARAGEVLPESRRSVTIHRLELESYEPPDARLVVGCSSGTYIRALADQIGRDAGCGAYVTRLRRTRIGPTSVEEALDLDGLRRRAADGAEGMALQSIDRHLGLPRIQVTGDARDEIVHGRLLYGRHVTAVDGAFRNGDLIAITLPDHGPAAIAEAAFDSGDRVEPDLPIGTYRRVLLTAH